MQRTEVTTIMTGCLIGSLADPGLPDQRFRAIASGVRKWCSIPEKANRRQLPEELNGGYKVPAITTARGGRNAGPPVSALRDGSRFRLYCGGQAISHIFRFRLMARIYWGQWPFVRLKKLTAQWPLGMDGEFIITYSQGQALHLGVRVTTRQTANIHHQSATL